MNFSVLESAVAQPFVQIFGVETLIFLTVVFFLLMMLFAGLELGAILVLGLGLLGVLVVIGYQSLLGGPALVLLAVFGVLMVLFWQQGVKG